MKARSPARGLRNFLGLVTFACVPGATLALAASPIATSFDLVIQAPDDPAINLAYAESEANAGRLLNAAAALERVLLTRPGAHGVRLFYATVLYRLDDMQGAEQQLRILQSAPLTPLQAAERDKYARIVASRQKTVRISGQVAAGIDYQSDAAGQLRAQFDVPGAVERRAGAAGVVSGRLDATIKLRPGLDIYTGAAAYSRSAVSGPKNELQNYAGQLGFSGTTLNGSWKLGALVRHYALFNDRYLTEYGGEFQASWRPTTAATFTGRFEAVRQSYDETSVSAALAAAGFSHRGHDGYRYDASLGFAYRLNARASIGVAGGYQWKTAAYRPFAYRAPYVQANFHGLLGLGAYVDLTGRMMFVDYRAADPVFLGPAPGVRRQSTISDVRLALGVPLNVFAAGGATGDALEDITLEAAAAYTHRAERFPVADYESFGGSLNLVWRFGDGT